MMPIEMSRMPAMTFPGGSSRRKTAPSRVTSSGAVRAHQRIGKRQVSGAVSLRKCQVVRKVDEGRRRDKWPHHQIRQRHERQGRAGTMRSTRPPPSRCRATGIAAAPGGFEQRVPAGMQQSHAPNGKGHAEDLPSKSGGEIGDAVAWGRRVRPLMARGVARVPARPRSAPEAGFGRLPPWPGRPRA